jgi:hypothetical protein
MEVTDISAEGLNFGFPDASDEAGEDDIGRSGDTSTVGGSNWDDYNQEAIDLSGEEETTDGNPPTGQPISGFEYVDPYPLNSYRPSFSRVNAGPSNLNNPPTPETCSASVHNYARPYVESYQAAPSLNSQCGFQKLLEFNIFESFSFSGMIDGAFCGFVRSIVNPAIDYANEKITTVNSYIPTNASINVSGQWELDENGDLNTDASWSVTGSEAFTNFNDSTQNSYSYKNNPGSVTENESANDFGNQVNDSAVFFTENPGLGYTPEDPFNAIVPNGNPANTDEPTNVEAIVPEQITAITPQSTANDSQTASTETSTNNGRVSIGGSDSEADSPILDDGSIDWGASTFDSFFSNN